MKIKYYATIILSDDENNLEEKFDLDFISDYPLTPAIIKKEFFEIASKLYVKSNFRKVTYLYDREEFIWESNCFK